MFGVPVSFAADLVCPTGFSLAYVEGEINNNAIGFDDPVFPNTSGIAYLKVATAKDGAFKLTCALSGNPTGIYPPHGPNFDHRIVCDDYEQSELSFDTSFIGSEPLDPKLETKLCRGVVQSYFQESAIPDSIEPSKGLFQGVSEGEIFVDGCVNVGSDPIPDIHINMKLDGYLCLKD